MIDDILINSGPRRRRIALVEDGRLMELYVSQRGARHPERIILGRVTKVQADLDAAFIHIGEGPEGLLSAADTPAKRGTPIAKAVREGQAIVVQVKREAEGEKGAKLSARPRLTGQGLVLLPHGQGAELSKQIKEPGRRRALQALAAALCERFSRGLVLRSAAARMGDDDLTAEAEALHDRWRKIAAEAKTASPGTLLDQGDDPVAVVLREHGAGAECRVRVDDAELASQLGRTWASVERPIEHPIEHHDGPDPLFQEYDLEEQIEAAFASHVALPGGGRIIIEHTQALTAIDVDSSQHDGAGDPGRLAREINTRAAREIARQLQLREIGGRVVIDFIPLRGKGEVAALLEKLRGWLNQDPGQVRLGRMSELGLVELTRRRRQPALIHRLGETCHQCGGGGTQPNARWVADNVLDRILRETAAAKGAALTVRVAPRVADDLGGAGGKLLTDLARQQGCRVHLIPDEALALEQFEIAAKQ